MLAATMDVVFQYINSSYLPSVVLVPLDHFSLVLVLVFGFEIILVSISSSTASLQ